MTELTAYVGVHRGGWPGELPNEVSVRFLADNHIEVSCRTGPDVRTVTLRRLREDLLGLATALRSDGTPESRRVASRVLSWPLEAQRMIAARYTSRPRSDAEEAEREVWIHALLATDPTTLSGDVLTAAVKLAPVWEGTPRELLDTARRVATRHTA